MNFAMNFLFGTALEAASCFFIVEVYTALRAHYRDRSKIGDETRSRPILPCKMQRIAISVILAWAMMWAGVFWNRGRTMQSVPTQSGRQYMALSSAGGFPVCAVPMWCGAGDWPGSNFPAVQGVLALNHAILLVPCLCLILLLPRRFLWFAWIIVVVLGLWTAFEGLAWYANYMCF